MVLSTERSSEQLSRREREFRRHRREIIRAAEAVFSEKGFLCATMEEISQEAEFAVGTLYKFFDNKADLYAATIRLRADELEEEVHRILKRERPSPERIQEYYECRISQFWRRPQFFRLFLLSTANALDDPRSGFLPELMQRYDRLLEKVDEVFRIGIEEGAFRDLRPRLLTLSLEGMIRGYLVHLMRQEEPNRQADEESALFRLFSQGALIGKQGEHP